MGPEARSNTVSHTIQNTGNQYIMSSTQRPTLISIQPLHMSYMLQPTIIAAHISKLSSKKP